MARRKLVEEISLDTLIPQYAENKSMLDDYKKICDEENKQIKNMMSEGSYEAGGYKATKSIQQRESMNEEKLLDELESLSGKHGGHIYDSIKDFRKQIYNLLKAHKVIKTKHYIDFDALESLMYNMDKENFEHDTLDAKSYLVDLIDSCRETKEVVILRVTKIKEKK